MKKSIMSIFSILFIVLFILWASGCHLWEASALLDEPKGLEGCFRGSAIKSNWEMRTNIEQMRQYMEERTGQSFEGWTLYEMQLMEMELNRLEKEKKEAAQVTPMDDPVDKAEQEIQALSDTAKIDDSTKATDDPEINEIKIYLSNFEALWTEIEKEFEKERLFTGNPAKDYAPYKTIMEDSIQKLQAFYVPEECENLHILNLELFKSHSTMAGHLMKEDGDSEWLDESDRLDDIIDEISEKQQQELKRLKNLVS